MIPIGPAAKHHNCPKPSSPPAGEEGGCRFQRQPGSSAQTSPLASGAQLSGPKQVTPTEGSA